MIHPDAFDALVTKVGKLNNLSPEVAFEVVCVVGDTPQLDQATGKIVAELSSGETLLVIYPDAN